MSCMRKSSAIVLATIAGAASAQITVDGILSPAEEAVYGPIRWTNTVPTSFGDNPAGAFQGGNFGDPENVATGIELCIPKSALGNTSSFRLSGWVNSGDRSFLSNQIIHNGLPIDTTNIGNGPIDWVGDARFPGDQWVQVSGIPSGTAAVDGTLDAGYQRYFLQTNFTGFGDNESEIDGVYVLQDANNIYLFVAGNLQGNGNGLDLFIDTDNGGAGAAGLLSGSGSGGFIVNAQSGMIFDAGFRPDVVVSVDSIDDGNGGRNARAFYGTNTGGDNFQVDLAGTLTGFNGAAGTLAGGDAGVPAIQLAVDNSNTAGVLGSASQASPVSPDANWAYGSELNNLRATVINDRLHIFIGGNMQVNFNKLVLWIDSGPGGQNAIRNDNPDIAFGGLNRAGPDPAMIDGPSLTFDADFTANYWIDINNGVDGGSGNLINFMDSAIVRTNGKARDLFGATIDYGCFSGGTVTNGVGVPAMNAVELISFDGPNIDAQDGTAENLFGSFAPGTSFDAVQLDPINPGSVAVAGQLQGAINNSNVDGVTSDTASAAAANAVSTGIEISIALSEFDSASALRGAPQDILLAGYISSGGFDFLSNQVFGDAPSLAMNDADMNGIVDNIGEVRATNFGDDQRFPGTQYVNLTAPAGPAGCNVADVAAEFGVLNVNDIIDFVNAFNGGNLAIADVSPAGGGDGLLNVNDIIDFVNAFNAGCP